MQNMQKNCQNCVNYIFLINYVVLMCYYLLLIQKVNKCCKKRLLWRHKKIKQKNGPQKPLGTTPFQQNDKPDSVPPKFSIVPAIPIPNKLGGEHN